jgi:hypothetical protein
MARMAGNPFDVLPANLFNLFSTQGFVTLQRHYMAILLRLYHLAEFNHQALAREVVVAEIVDYLKVAGAEAEVAADMAGQDEQDADDSTASRLIGARDEQTYAGYLLRQLERTGWIEREQHADYSETITLPDYAATLLEALRTIQEQKPREFTGQLYTAHQLLLAPPQREGYSSALALTQAYENVRLLVRGLSELNQNIRRYIERATRGRSSAELLALQFNDYALTLGPTYHALKTSDHVSRYRRDIVGRLRAWQHKREPLERAAEDLATQMRITPAQAAQEIDRICEFIVNQLEGLDPLLEEIDRRHALYLRTSLRQIRYQLVGSDGSFRDRLVLLARQLAAQLDAGEDTLPADAPGSRYAPVRAPDAHSFYTPPQRRAPMVTADIDAPPLDPSDLAALRAATLQDAAQALTPVKLNRYVLACFNGHRTLHARDLPPDLLADLPRLAAVLAYSHHPDVSYGVAPVDGEPIDTSLYRIMPFQLERL